MSEQQPPQLPQSREESAGWVEIIRHSNTLDEADCHLAAEAQDLHRQSKEVQDWMEAMELERKKDELAQLRADLRRVRQLRQPQPAQMNKRPIPPSLPSLTEPEPEPCNHPQP